MKTVKPMRLSLLTRVFEQERRSRLVIGVMAAFRLSKEKELISDFEMWPLAIDALAAESGILDEAMAKVRGEVLVAGSCYPPGGTAAAVSFVRVKVGSVDKRLAVLGDRQWKYGVPTEPQPFTKMPVDWAHAFGGEGFEKNPKGRGFAAIDTPAGRLHALPNIEDPKKLINAPSDRPDAMGFGGMDLTQPQRKSKFGTYDKKWLETRAFGFAADMDPTIFNLSSPDQWLDGYFGGDETFVIENMHPSRARIEGKLPPLAVRVFVTQQQTDKADSFKEILTRIDTLRLFPEHDMGVLIYRGTIETREDDAEDITELLLACEDRSAPRPVEHYQQALVARRNHEQAGLLALSEHDLVPQPELGWVTIRPSAQITDMPGPEFIRNENFKRRQQVEIEASRERLIAAGLDPKAFSLDSQQPVPEVNQEDPQAVAEFVRQQMALSASRKEELEKNRKAVEDSTRAGYAAAGKDYDKEVAKAKKDAAGPPKFNARKQLEQMKSLLAIAREHNQPLVEMEQQLAEPAYQQDLLQAEQRMKALYQANAHRQEPVDPQARDAAEIFRIELEMAHLNAISLEARDYSGADLSKMNLAGIDMSGGFLEAVDLTATDLSGAKLDNAVLAHANLSGTNLSGASLVGANLGRTKIIDADLSGAVLTKTNLENAHIENSSFARVKFDKTSLIETTMGPNVDFSGASAELMIFLKLDLRGVRFRGARFNKCAFVECDLRGADLSGIDLIAILLMTCPADGARFNDATLIGTQFVVNTTLAEADFRGANLSSASLRGLDMRRARFKGAVLDCADLSKSDLTDADLDGISAQKAMFMGSNLTRAKMNRANLLSALLTKAKLFGTHLVGANLFQADLAKVRTDGETKIDRANLGRARVHPKANNGP